MYFILTIYRGEVERNYNIRLNNHWKDVKKNWCNNSFQTISTAKPKFQQVWKVDHYRPLMNTSNSKETQTQQIFKRENYMN